METWKKFTDFLNHPFVQLLGGSGVLAVITWIVTHIAKLPVWEIWLAVVFTVGCALWIINQIEAWQQRHKKKISKFSNQELENIIREWVNTPAFSCKKEEQRQEAYFMFRITDNFGHVVFVYRPKEPTLSSVIRILTQVDLKTQLGTKQMAASDWQKLTNKIEYEMVKLGVEVWYENKENHIIKTGTAILIEDSLADFNFRERILLEIRSLAIIGAVCREFVTN